MADVAVPSFKKRSKKIPTVRKRATASPPPESNSESDDTDDTDDEAGVRVKRRKKDGVSVVTTSSHKAPDALSKSTAFTADRTTNITANDDATKTSNWHVEAATAAVAAAAAKTRPPQDDDPSASGTYKGTAQYGSFIQKAPDARPAVGPVRGATNVRTITVTDFAPDVCKDYKQTGFCGFGDNCKFLHAREDYAQGWQLDREWEKGRKAGQNKNGKQKDDVASSGAKTAADGDGDDEEKTLSSIPFACILCKQPYRFPVVTKCGHYFCEPCAMGRYQREGKRACAACGADTGGTFQVARKLKELLEKKKRREEARMEEAEKDREENGG